jgi:hypothetical protein
MVRQQSGYQLLPVSYFQFYILTTGSYIFSRAQQRHAPFLSGQRVVVMKMEVSEYSKECTAAFFPPPADVR